MADSGITIDPTGTIDPEDLADEKDAKLRELRGEFEGYYTAKNEAANKAMREINNHRGISGNGQNLMEEIHKYRDAKMQAGLTDVPLADELEAAADEIPGNPKGGPSLLNAGRKGMETLAGFVRYMNTPSSYVGMPDVIAPAGTEDYEAAPLGGDTPILFGVGMTFPTSPRQFDVTRTDDWYQAVEGWFNAVDQHIEQAESTGISQGGSKAVAWVGRTFIGEPLRALRELQDADLTRTPSDSPTGTETIQKVVNNAANVGVLSSAVPVPAGALRLFGGKVAAENLTAQGFPHAESALAIAKKMKTAGKSEDEIRKATNDIMEEAGLGGISIGADGKLRFEVSDKYSAVKHWEAMKSGEEYNLGMIFDHPTLYKMFPDIGLDVTVSVNKVTGGMRNFKPSASYQPDTRHISINARNEEEARSALLHELQHEIQFQERFSFGGNVDMMRGSLAEDEIRRGMRGLDLRERVAKYGSSDPAHAAYSRLEGEVEAKNVQTRADYTARERRAQKPEDTEAFPRDQQINEGHLQLDEVPPGLRTAYSKGDVDLASDVAPRDWAPHTGMNKHLKKDYVLIDNQTGEPVGSAATKQGADRSAGKRGGREDEASTIRVEKTQDFLDRKWNEPEMKNWRETQLERARGRTQEMAFEGQKMSARDISYEEKRLATSLKSNTVRKEALERDLKDPDRWNASERGRKEAALAKHQERIDTLQGKLTELAKIKETRGIIPSRVNEIRETVARDISQGAPKTMSEDIGNMPKRRSKLERLREEEESLITIAEGEPRIARVQQAKKRLEATRRKIKELIGE
jgi:hypothetical protein